MNLEIFEEKRLQAKTLAVIAQASAIIREARLGLPQFTPTASGAAITRPSDHNEDAKHERDVTSAIRIVSEIVPLIGTPGAPYLRDVRKIDVGEVEDVMSRADAIGWHSPAYFSEPKYPRRGDTLPIHFAGVSLAASSRSCPTP